MSCICWKNNKIFAHSQAAQLGKPHFYKHQLILDIDETLLHTSDTHTLCDAIITTSKCDVLSTLYVTLRPYARELIVYMSKYYNIYLYSASCHEVLA